MDPIPVELCKDAEEGLKQDSVDLTFLGNGFLELRMAENLLGGERYDEVYFVGIHRQNRNAVKREAEAFDEEWRNDRYTSGLHPDNNKRLKRAMDQYGLARDTGDSSATDEDEDDEDEDEV
jgi:ribosomal protein S2